MRPEQQPQVELAPLVGLEVVVEVAVKLAAEEETKPVVVEESGAFDGLGPDWCWGCTSVVVAAAVGVDVVDAAAAAVAADIVG